MERPFSPVVHSVEPGHPDFTGTRRARGDGPAGNADRDREAPFTGGARIAVRLPDQNGPGRKPSQSMMRTMPRNKDVYLIRPAWRC